MILFKRFNDKFLEIRETSPNTNFMHSCSRFIVLVHRTLPNAASFFLEDLKIVLGFLFFLNCKDESKLQRYF